MCMSHTAARRLSLAAQGLLRPPGHPTTKAIVLATIRRMGALQIDTIQVVARSPYLVLWSRLGAYDPRWLDELLKEYLFVGCCRPLAGVRLLLVKRVALTYSANHHTRCPCPC